MASWALPSAPAAGQSWRDENNFGEAHFPETLLMKTELLNIIYYRVEVRIKTQN